MKNLPARKLCIAMLAATLAGCAGQAWQAPWVKPKSSDSKKAWALYLRAGWGLRSVPS